MLVRRAEKGEVPCHHYLAVKPHNKRISKMIKRKTRSTRSAATIKAQIAARRARAAERVSVEPQAFRLEEARHYLGGLSIPTMYALVQRGLLRPNRSTRHLIFSKEELLRFLKEGMGNE
jgi:Helix-turn-helix domain